MKMTLTLILIALSVPIIATSQTYKMEVDYLNLLLFTHEKTPLEISQMKKALDDACGNSKTYPVLPYDTLTGTFNYTYILECNGMSKKVLFERAKAWCALSYTDIDAVLQFADFESGKIIIKGYAPMAMTQSWKGIFGQKRTASQIAKGLHTSIITIKEGRVKFEIRDIRFLFSSLAYYSPTTGTYESGSGTELYLNQMFPITKNENSNEWTGFLGLARQSVVEYERHKKSLYRYLLDWENDYKF